MKRLPLTAVVAVALATSGCLTRSVELPIGMRLLAEVYIGDRRSRESVLESVILPQAEVAAGFGKVGILLIDGASAGGTLIEEDGSSVTLEVGGDRRQIARVDIANLTPPVSGMPAMGTALTQHQLRDLIEYLSTL
ncbi:MAG: hypothetical protein JRH16_00480 [Deltaproteobacteria bacterium]|nr:hypothetical protein [Deltaproteobacteria bacterium]MBW2359438.1 hypothetical protein [Deltaproteobacteria bacterium]